MERNDKILEHVHRSGKGIEIGPSIDPIAPKREGFDVDVIDHMNRADLVAQYDVHGYDTNVIEDVDFVWTGERYADLVGKTGHYDWIIASHVIEHIPDLVGFLVECSELLNEDGVISLVVPDKRYCFDRFRPISGLGQLIDRHLDSAKIHTVGTVAEFKMNATVRDHELSWSSTDTGQLQFLHPLSDVEEAMSAVTERAEYVDCHAWCFVPHSFRMLIDDLFTLGMIDVREVDFFPTVGFEFYITLGKRGAGPGLPRMEMAGIVDEEVEAMTAAPPVAASYRLLLGDLGDQVRSDLKRLTPRRVAAGAVRRLR